MTSYKDDPLTDGFSIIAFKAKVPWVAVTLPGLVAGPVLAVPVWHALGAVRAGPALAADTSVRHHTEPLR